MLALIAGSVSCLHTHLTVESRGQPDWVTALMPLSVHGMIVAASITLLTDSLAGKPGGVLPWALLAVGSVASLAANVAVAEPTAAGRVIATWPSRRFPSAAPTMELMRPQFPRLAVFGYGALAAALGVSSANGYGGGRSCGGANSPAAHLVNKPGARKVPATSSAAWRLARLQACVAQEREHGRDTPVHLLLAGQVQLGEDRVDVLLD